MRIWTLVIILVAGVAVAVISAIAADSTTTQPSAPQASVVLPTTRQLGQQNFQNNNNRNGNNRQRQNRNQRFNRRAVSAPSNLPTNFEEVAIRNIFVKGNQRPPQIDPRAQQQQLSTVYTPAPNQLVLTGVSLEDNEQVAFLEDQQANTATEVRVGDKISTGKVVNIIIDALDYQDANGKTVRVNVGFNLAGGDAWGTSNSTSVSSSSSSSTSQPSGAVNVGPKAPGESMLDYLKRRRAAEAGK